jgi:hypothetical protein
VILGFFRDIDEIYTLLGYYAASSSNNPDEHRSKLSVSFKVSFTFLRIGLPEKPAQFY